MTEERPAEEQTTIVTELTLPVGPECPGGYVGTRVDTHLSNRAARALKRLTLGLDREQMRLANDRRVTSGPQAISWLLEQLAKAMNI